VIELRKCKTAEEVRRNFREVRRRLNDQIAEGARRLKPPPRPVPVPVPAPISEPEPQIAPELAPAPEQPPAEALPSTETQMRIWNRSQKIIKAVTASYGIAARLIIGPSRQSKHVQPRHVAEYLVYVLSELSLPQIGVIFGHRDHTSVLHGVRTVESKMQFDQDLAARVEMLLGLLQREGLRPQRRNLNAKPGQR
jgi:hypothetical protein